MKITEFLTVTEVSVAIATVAFVLLVIFLIITLIKIRKSVEAAQHDLHRTSLEFTSFLSKMSELSSQIQKKSEFSFDNFSSFLESQPSPSEGQADFRPTLKLIGWILSSLFLLRKTKNFIKSMVK